MKFLDSVHGWIAHLRLARYSPATVHHYSDQIKRFGVWLNQQTLDDLRSLTRAHLDAYQRFVRSEPIGVETQALRIRVVKRLFSYLLKDGQLLFDPTAHLIELRRCTRLPKTVPSVRQIQRLLAAPNCSLPQGIRDRALLEVLYGTGIRVGELEKVTIHHVDLDLHTLQVRHAKGGRMRIVPLTQAAVRWLKEYLHQVRPRLAKRRPFERALFIVRGGKPLAQTQIRHLIGHYRRAAGIKPSITPHSLRHACATHLLQAGADLTTIQQLLGHARLDTTQIYTRVAPLEVKAMHQRFHPHEPEQQDKENNQHSNHYSTTPPKALPHALD